MTAVWSEGYVTDLGYAYGYYRETSPVYQRFCLLLRGLACNDVDATAAHCELGFGQGVSVNINAVSNPGRYVATDFNPSHAAYARAMASHAGGNLRLHDDSFEQLLARDDLPEFDSISLHGIWSWVSRDNHRLITQFAAKHLKPGGILYVSYNCFPGWAPAYPLRQIFALHNRFAPGPVAITQRIDAAMNFSEALLASRPLFAIAASGLDARLQWIAGQSRGYLAHEYFNRDWNCMYFTEVADALAEAKLEFASTAEPLDTVDAVNLTAAGMAFLNGVEHPILREQMRDYFVNRQFRKDLYLRGIRLLSDAEQREQSLATRIVLEHAADAIPMTVTSPQGEATLDADLFRPFIAALAADDYAPKSFNDLTRALPGVALPRLMTAGAVLVGAGHAAPCQDEAAAGQVRAACDALNRHLIERARISADVNHLASPVMGAGIAVGRFEQLFLLARSRGHARPTEWARFAWGLLAELGQTLVKDGQALQTPEAAVAELIAQANTFARDQLPILLAVGIA